MKIIAVFVLSCAIFSNATFANDDDERPYHQDMGSEQACGGFWTEAGRCTDGCMDLIEQAISWLFKKCCTRQQPSSDS